MALSESLKTYKVIITPHAETLLLKYIDYIQYTLYNDQAADNVLQDANDTASTLEKVAGSLNYCNNTKLRNLGYRKIYFLRHNYVMIYMIEGNIAYVDAIYHQSQDYENLFSEKLGL